MGHQGKISNTFQEVDASDLILDARLWDFLLIGSFPRGGNLDGFP